MDTSRAMSLDSPTLTRQANIIPLDKGIVERPSPTVSNAEAATLLATPPLVSVQIPVPPATLPETTVADQGTMPVAIVDPGPPAVGMGSQLINWAKANPLPAVAIGIGVIYLISEMTRGSKKD